MDYSRCYIYILLILIVFLFWGCSNKRTHRSGNSPISYHQTKIPSAFERLPLGQIKPKGWIKAQMVGDLKNGYTGHLDSLTKTVQISIFGSQRISHKDDSGRAWWNAETTGNWLNGLVRMAFLTQDQKAMRKARYYIDYVLNHQDSSGYIGIYKPNARYNHPGENGELWGQTCIFRAMLSYYEFTKNERVLNAVVKATDLTMDHYGPQHSYFEGQHHMGASHGLMFVDVLKWLYQLTGDQKYVKFADWLYTDFSKNYRNPMGDDARLKNLLNKNKPLVAHTPNIIEHLRVPIWLYYATGKKIYRKAYEIGYKKLEDYMVPSGAVSSGNNEWIDAKPPTPNISYEYCGILELLDTQELLTTETGNKKYADMAEALVLNAAQGARFPNGKAISYFSKVNFLKATNKKEGGRLDFSPTQEDVAVCCVPNAGRVMPFYVTGMWYKTTVKEDKRKGIVAMFFGPSSVETRLNSVKVRIDEHTNFPFSQKITFKVQPGKATKFSIWLRDPAWCRNLKIKVSGAKISKRGGYKIISKKWHSGDTFQVTYTSDIQTVKTRTGDYVFKKGPFLYALRLQGNREKTKNYHYDNFYDYNIVPALASKEKWNLHLKANQANNNFEFKFYNNAPYDSLHPWKQAPEYIKGKLYDKNQNAWDVTLVPIGTTILRRAAFSVH